MWAFDFFTCPENVEVWFFNCPENVGLWYFTYPENMEEL
jgi:hypothetical protein